MVIKEALGCRVMNLWDLGRQHIHKPSHAGGSQHIPLSHALPPLPSYSPLFSPQIVPTRPPSPALLVSRTLSHGLEGTGGWWWMVMPTYPGTAPPQAPASLTCSSWNNNSARTRWQSRVTRSRATAEASRAGSLSGGPTLARRSARDLIRTNRLRVKAF